MSKLPKDVFDKAQLIDDSHVAFCAERMARWLMEEVCDQCGGPFLNGQCPCASLVIGVMTRAEFLRRSA